MTPEQLVRAVPALLALRDGARVLEWWCTPQGMNSVTVGIALTSGRFVVKWVPAREAIAMRHGVRAAHELAEHGMRVGAPARLANGALSAQMEGGEVAVLRYVAGEPLTTSATDQESWGNTLGRAHRLAPRPRGSLHDVLDALGIHAAPRAAERWVRRARSDVVDALPAHRNVPWVQLHTDPAPEAFLRDEHGDVGLIDWTGSVAGPAMYDVASAVMYAGGVEAAQTLLAAYSRRFGTPLTSLHPPLLDFLRLRGVVQACYFSARLSRADPTDSAAASENRSGLRDARELLRGLGVDVT